MVFFTDFDENGNECSASDGESESVLILKNLFCTLGQKSIFLDFKTKNFAVDIDFLKVV